MKIMTEPAVDQTPCQPRPPAVPFCDLAAQNAEAGVQAAVAGALARGDFVLGAPVRDFEAAWARYLGVAHCVGVASGLDALTLALQALGVGCVGGGHCDDEVLVPANTFVATALAVVRAGARPVFVDVDAATCNMSVTGATAAITQATRAIIAVHLYGQPADMAALRALATQHDLRLIEDAAQAHGACYRTRKAGTLADAACFSFYPSKNLGACGDGGALVTDDAALAARVRAMGNYGQVERYHHTVAGAMNSRLDSLQAAVLLAKLPLLDRWNLHRLQAAGWYAAGLRALAAAGHVCLPVQQPDRTHVFHLYVIQLGAPERRNELLLWLLQRGVQAAMHYPLPCHLQRGQPFYAPAPALPVTEALAQRVVSLPMHPHITHDQVRAVCAALCAFFNQAA